MNAHIKWISVLVFATFIAACSSKKDPAATTAKKTEPAPQFKPDDLTVRGRTADGRNFGPTDYDQIAGIRKVQMFNSMSNGPRSCRAETLGINPHLLLTNSIINTGVQQVNFCVEDVNFELTTDQGLALNERGSYAYLLCNIEARKSGYGQPVEVRLNTTVTPIEIGHRYKISSRGDSTQMRMMSAIHVRDLLGGDFTSLTFCGYMLHFEGDFLDKNNFRNGRYTNIGNGYGGEIVGSGKTPEHFDNLEDIDGYLKHPDLTKWIHQDVSGMHLTVGASKDRFSRYRKGAILKLSCVGQDCAK